MAFTNIWDTAFPPDTQLANLLGQDLRSFRLDVQQRMGAISGLDAAKPAFGTDAQPANWNGVLFFATDTGKIYQWTMPNWVDITASLTIGGVRKIFQAANQVVAPLNLVLNNIYVIPVPAWVNGNSIRIRLNFQCGTMGAPFVNLKLFANAHAVTLATSQFNSAYNSQIFAVDVLLCAGPTGTFSNWREQRGALATFTTGNFSAGLTINELEMAVQLGTNTDQVDFNAILVEFIP